MVEDFLLAGECRFSFERGELVFHYMKEHKTLRSYPRRELDPEALKSWLEEATQPRYEVKKLRGECPGGYMVVDSQEETAIEFAIMAKFYFDNNYNAEKEANALCKRLNQIFIRDRED